MIHVNRGATSLGAFSDEEVREGLRTGRFQGNDLGWREGMPSWKQLSQFPEFTGEASSGAAPGTPASTPPATVPPVESTFPGPEARSGLPWEHRQERGFFQAFIETLGMVLTKPDVAFRTMRTEGGLFEPLLYALIGGCLGGIVSLIFSVGMQSMGMFAGQRDAFNALAGIGIGTIGMIILLPLVIVFCVFVGAAIVHVCLMIVGGANKSFETTFRVLSFTHGSTGPLNMIPVCGGFVAGIWALVANCIGLARAHETTTGRAVIAVLLPVIVCCGGAIFVGMMVGAMGAWSGSH